MRKGILVIAGVLVAFFGLNRLGAIVTGRVNGGMAWASAWNGSAIEDDDAAASPDEATEPDTAPPDISGPWAGGIEDSLEGPGDFELEINQSGSKVSGTWSTSLGGSGNFKGTVNGKGKVKIKLMVPIEKHHGCHAATHGTATDSEIDLFFKFAGCGPHSGSEFGTITLERDM